MQTMSQRIEHKQNLLKERDPEKEASLDKMFVEYIAALYRDNLLSPKRTQEEAHEAAKVYEQALDEALRDERAAEDMKGAAQLVEEARTEAEARGFLTGDINQTDKWFKN